jgi:hypothetical protein
MNFAVAENSEEGGAGRPVAMLPFYPFTISSSIGVVSQLLHDTRSRTIGR